MYVAGVGRGHLKKLLFVLVIIQMGKGCTTKQVFRTLFFMTVIFYINEELLEDFRFSTFFFFFFLVWLPLHPPPQWGSLGTDPGAFQGEAGLPGT